MHSRSQQYKTASHKQNKSGATATHQFGRHFLVRAKFSLNAENELGIVPIFISFTHIFVGMRIEQYIFRSEFWYKSTYDHVLRYCDIWMTAKYIAMNDNAYDYYLRIETHVKIFVMSSNSIRWNSSTYVKMIYWVILHAKILTLYN